MCVNGEPQMKEILKCNGRAITNFIGKNEKNQKRGNAFAFAA